MGALGQPLGPLGAVLGASRTSKSAHLLTKNHTFENPLFRILELLMTPLGPILAPPGPSLGLKRTSKWPQKWSKIGSKTDPKNNQKKDQTNTTFGAILGAKTGPQRPLFLVVFEVKNEFLFWTVSRRHQEGQRGPRCWKHQTTGFPVERVAGRGPGGWRQCQGGIQGANFGSKSGPIFGPIFDHPQDVQDDPQDVQDDPQDDPDDPQDGPRWAPRGRLGQPWSFKT